MLWVFTFLHKQPVNVFDPEKKIDKDRCFEWFESNLSALLLNDIDEMSFKDVDLVWDLYVLCLLFWYLKLWITCDFQVNHMWFKWITCDSYYLCFHLLVYLITCHIILINKQVFFPICRADHFYVLVFDIRKVPAFYIIDNRSAGGNFNAKYKRVCNLVVSLTQSSYVSIWKYYVLIFLNKLLYTAIFFWYTFEELCA